MIGIFDSGLGGLTILRGLVMRLPQYGYIYFGDTKNAPYGEKTHEEIIELTKQGIEFLFARGAHLVILGCNTASTVALRHIQQQWLPEHYPDKKVLGIVVPTVEQITGADWKHASPITTPISEEVFQVGVLATPTTVGTHAYINEIHKRNQSIQVTEEACSGLANAIEAADGATIKYLVERCTTSLLNKAPNVQAVLLGCTHYEIIAEQIIKTLPPNITLYRQPNIVAKSLEAYLARHKSIADKIDQDQKRLLFSSGDEARTSGELYFKSLFPVDLKR